MRSEEDVLPRAAAAAMLVGLGRETDARFGICMCIVCVPSSLVSHPCCIVCVPPPKICVFHLLRFVCAVGVLRTPRASNRPGHGCGRRVGQDAHCWCARAGKVLTAPPRHAGGGKKRASSSERARQRACAAASVRGRRNDTVARRGTVTSCSQLGAQPSLTPGKGPEAQPRARSSGPLLRPLWVRPFCL